MPVRRSIIPTVLTCLAALAATAGVVAPAAHARADMESMFQDDNRLIFDDSADGTAKTMDTLKELGVDRIRVSVFWATVAPQSTSNVRPAFNAADPAAYPAGSWDRYDRIVRLARARNIAVNFNVTSPAPYWATGDPGDRPDLKNVYSPDAKEFGLFLRAVGTRYSGAYKSTDGQLIPRVRYWTIWNEPNQGAWLAPQSAKDPRSPKATVATSPIIYRGLVDAAFAGLTVTNHGSDTILIGETAPKGTTDAPDVSKPVAPLKFLRELYCLDDNLQFYKGSSATLRSCPTGANALTDFVTQHPALFKSTGWAHHPYAVTSSPTTRFKEKDWVTIGNLGDMEKILRRVYQRFRQPIPKGEKSPRLYLTEFGYQTNPPDLLGVSFARQSAYLNQSEYIAWRNKDVFSTSQFQLQDDPKPEEFQSGLETVKGVKKPAYAAYAMAIYLPSRAASKSRRLKIWGMPRVIPKDTAARVGVEIRSKNGKKYRHVGSIKTDGKRGYLYGSVKVTRDGSVRLAWKSPAGKTYRSRGVSFRVRK